MQVIAVAVLLALAFMLGPAAVVIIGVAWVLFWFLGAACDSIQDHIQRRR